MTASAQPSRTASLRSSPFLNSSRRSSSEELTTASTLFVPHSDSNTVRTSTSVDDSNIASNLITEDIHNAILQYQRKQEAIMETTLFNNTSIASQISYTDNISHPSPSGLRLNLQESIDGEISESHKSRSFDSTHSLISSNLSSNSNKSVFPTNNWVSLNSTKYGNFNSSDAEWMNLDSTKMQDINRPEPLGFARSDEGVPLTQNLTSVFSSTSVSHSSNLSLQTNSNILNKNDAIVLSQDRTAVSATTFTELSYNENVITSNITSVTTLSTTSSLNSNDLSNLRKYRFTDVDTTTNVELENKSSNLGESKVLIEPQNLSAGNSSQATSFAVRQDMLGERFDTVGDIIMQDNTSVGSVSSGRKSDPESPARKLLGASYKKNKRFLEHLKANKLANIDEKHCNVFEKDMRQSKNEEIQVGDSKLHYSLLPSFDESKTLHAEHLLLREQNISTASDVETITSEMRIINLNKYVDDKLSCSVMSKFSDNAKDSEGELLITDLTDTQTQTNQSLSQKFESQKDISSTSVQSSRHKYTSYTSSTFSNLEPIQEVSTPEAKDNVKLIFCPTKGTDSSVTSASNLSPQISRYSATTDDTSALGSSPLILKADSSNLSSKTKTSNISKSLKRQSKNGTRTVSNVTSKNSKNPEQLTNASSSDLYRSVDFRVQSFVPAQKKHRTLDQRTNELVDKVTIIPSTNNIHSSSEDTDELLDACAAPVASNYSLKIDLGMKDMKNKKVKPFQQNMSYKFKTSKAEFKFRNQAHQETSISNESNLSKLWREFDQTFDDKDHSPVLDKIELLSKILDKQKRQRERKVYQNGRTVLLSTDTTDSSSTSITPSPRNQVHKKLQPQNFERSIKKDKLFNCPYCRKRDVETSFPTPHHSDTESSSRPLMLQTWTQTTANTELQEKRDLKSKKIKQTFNGDKENDKNLLNMKSLKTDGKVSIYSSVSDSENSELALTAWFQAIGSDDSENIFPLSKLPGLYSHYKDRVTKMRTHVSGQQR